MMEQRMYKTEISNSFWKMILMGLVLVSLVAGSAFAADEKSDNGFDNINVILVSLQCLRLDHMGIGGYERDTTPNMDRISKSSVLFENSIAQTNLTPVAMMAALTGKHPRVNGMVTFDITKDSVPGRTMSDILKVYDYHTAAVLSTPEFFLRFDGKSGDKINLRDVFSRSYDQYLWPKRKAGRSMRVLPTESLDWLEKNKDKKFFLWIAAGSMHPPYAAAVPEPEKSMYDPPGYKGAFWKDYFPITGNEGAPDDPTIDRLLRVWNDKYYMGFKPVHELTEDDKNYIISRYDAGVHYTDKFIGALDAKLKETGLDKNTIVIYYSIHGKALGENGGTFINYDLYETVVKNLLMIRFPNGEYAGRWIKDQVQGVDILPTLLDYLNIPLAADLQGTTLMPLIRDEPGAKGSEYAYIDRMPFWEHWMSRFFLEFKFQNARKRNHPPSEDEEINKYATMLKQAFPYDKYPPGDIAIRTNKWKLIVRKDPRLLEKVSWPAFIQGHFIPVTSNVELYDLEADPFGQHNVAEKYPEITADLKAKLMKWDAEEERLKAPYYRPGEKRYIIPYPGEG